jgi:uncharacterized protein
MRRAALIGLALAARLAGAAEPIPPSPDRHVTDRAGFLRTETAAALDAKLDAYERQTGHQVLVWIGDSLDGAPLDDWAVRTFAAWKVGRKGFDDGLVMFVLARDRKIDIEVGYGLEDRVPDARAKQVIEDTMAPLLRAGKPDDAVTAGVDAILTAIEGHPVGTIAPEVQRPPQQLSKGRLVVYGILALIMIVLAITNPRLAVFFLLNILSGGRGGGWGGGGGGGGGWSGGGGRSGGGGARGGW